MSHDENYYWVWSKNLQLSYFDHPAMVSWLFKLGAIFESLGNAVRWPAVVLGHLTLLVWVYILRAWLDETHIKGWLLLALFSPLIGFGSLIVTPDLPVVFFWSLSILFFQRLLDRADQTSALLLGMALGFGFCSKYHIVLFVPCALACLVFLRHWDIFRPRIFLCVMATGLIFSLPVLIWNFKNDFSSFSFQLKHGLSRPQWKPFWTYSYVIGQIVLLFPIPVWLAMRSRLRGTQRILIFFSLGPLLFFFLSSFKALVEMNWPIVGYHSFYAMTILGWKKTKALSWTIGLWLCLGILVISQVLFSWIPNAPEKLKEVSTFQVTLAAKQKYVPLYAESYQMASFIWYQTKSPTYKLFQMSRVDFFDSLPQSRPTSTPFYVVMDRNASLPIWIDDGGYQKEVQEELGPTFIVLKIDKK